MSTMMGSSHFTKQVYVSVVSNHLYCILSTTKTILKSTFEKWIDLTL